MPILNYTTKISAGKTVGQIQGKLAKHGARRILIDYDDDGQPAALAFQLDVAGRSQGYRLPCNHEGVLRALQQAKGVAPRQRTPEHALRVAWRIIDDWLDVQLAIIDAGIVDFDRVMFPYLLAPSGETVFDVYQRNQFLLLEDQSE